MAVVENFFVVSKKQCLSLKRKQKQNLLGNLFDSNQNVLNTGQDYEKKKKTYKIGTIFSTLTCLPRKITGI